MLYNAAKKFNSQALEADALHFKTDIWSSSVVIMGLAGVTLAGYYKDSDWLIKADSIAALIVALIVIFISLELGWRTVQALLDAAPNGIHEAIVKKVQSLDGIKDCHAVRIRPSGARYFVDLHVTMDGNSTLNEAHALSEVVEQKVQELLPMSDVTVHVEPAEMAEVNR
jgi:cation diffusion facilitator family transporter